MRKAYNRGREKIIKGRVTEKEIVQRRSEEKNIGE